MEQLKKVFAVEVIEQFREVSFVEANNSEHAEKILNDIESNGNETIHIDKYLGANIFSVKDISHDLENQMFLKIKDTEQPTLNKENFLNNVELWKNNNINKIQYD